MSRGRFHLPRMNDYFAQRALDELYQALYRAALRNGKEVEAIVVPPDVEWVSLLYRTVMPGLRPVFHQLERRVDTHIFLSILAYHLLVSIEKTMPDKGVHSSRESLRDRLRTHETCTIVLSTDSGETLHIRKGSTPEAVHREIYTLLDLPPN